MTGALTIVALAGIGIDRVVGRWAPRRLERVRGLWLDGRSWAVAYVRSAPATYAYLAVLFATSWILVGLGGRLSDRVLLAQSTNLHQLEHVPVRALVGSALWAPGKDELLLCAILFTLVLAPVERRIGSLRTVGVFALGHVGASLVIAGGLLIALRLGAVTGSVVDARDVGTSYGFYAVAAAMTYLLARRLRPAYAAALVAYLAVGAALAGGFGDYGHLAAAGIGFACFPLVATASWRRRPILGSIPRGRAVAS